MNHIEGRYVHTTYCDDVRMEVGNKMSHIGVYMGQLEVEGNGSIALPKLCVVAVAQTPKDQPFKKLTFRLMQDEKVIQTVDIPSQNIQEVIDLSGKDPSARFHVYGTIMQLIPFLIDGNSVLSVFVDTESETLEGGRLNS